MIMSTSLCLSKQKAHTKSLKVSNQQVIDAKQIFLNRCSSCHGAKGQGGEGPKLQGANIKADDVKFTVTHGVPGEMPSFAKTLKPAEVDALAKYVPAMK
jgi:mono/diheme cytochrome c family protein